MVNDIINGITNTLYNEFENVKIHIDSLNQGFESPCFFVLPLTTLDTPLLNTRSIRTIAFNIHYFPRKKSNREIQDVSDRLFAVLKQISLLDGTLLNGWNLRSETIDGVLQFFVEFKPTVISKVEESEPMGSMELDFNIKE